MHGDLTLRLRTVWLRVMVCVWRNATRQHIPVIVYGLLRLGYVLVLVVVLMVVTAIRRAWTRLGRGQLLPLLQAAMMRG